MAASQPKRSDPYRQARNKQAPDRGKAGLARRRQEERLGRVAVNDEVLDMDRAGANDPLELAAADIQLNAAV